MTRTRPHMRFEHRQEPPVNTMPGGEFPPPEVMKRLHQEAADQRRVSITTKVRAEESRDASLLAIGLSEHFLDWLSFLLLDRVYALHYGGIVSAEAQESLGAGRILNTVKTTMGFRPSFEERTGHRGAVAISTYRPPRDLNLREYIERIPGKPLISALTWYRKGHSALTPEDQFVNWWTGLEILSVAIDPKATRPVKCPGCGMIRMIGAANTAALRQHIEATLNLSDKVFERLHRIRSAIIHGGKSLDEPSRSELATYLNGLSTLFVSMALRVFNQDRPVDGIPAWYHHPVLGSLEHLSVTLGQLPK